MKKITAVILCVCLCFSALSAFASAGAYETPYGDSLFFEYGDYSIHYRIVPAAGEKAKIMMIHGFALSGYCWNELAARFSAEGYTCVIPDLPDFGYSTRETSSTNRLPREEIIHALMEELGGGKWIVAGHSMGGYIALSLMQTYPESVSALLLYSTSGYDGMSPALVSVLSVPGVAAVMGAFMDIAASNDMLFNLLLRSALLDNGYYASYNKAMVKEPARIKGTGLGAVYSFLSINATDYEGLKTCGKPVYFCNGGSDRVIAQSARDKLVSYLPADAVSVTLEGGGHMFIENMADEVSSSTLSFLGGCNL